MAAISLITRRPKARASALRRREARAGFLFILPWLIGLLVFQAYPILASIYLSFTNYNIIQPPRWVGLDNFSTMFTADTDFWSGVGNSIYYAAIAVPVGLILSLALALVLNMRVRGVGIYRSLFYLPALAPPVVSTVVFLMLLDPNQGIINTLLRSVGLPGPAWFLDPSWSKPALILLYLWNAGTYVLIFLAGLQEIPQTLIEAALIDGANRWQRFRHVTLPLLSPVVLYNLVMGVIWSFQVFDQALTVGGNTGDPLGSTLMFMVLIYRDAFQYFQMGYASALSMVLVLVVVAMTALIFRTSRLWVYYEGEQRGA
jgi:multiple sugar transport system permease protein